MRKLWLHIAADRAVDQLVCSMFPALLSEARLFIWAGLILLQLAILWRPVSQWVELGLNSD
jgi:hypothetical protein